MNPAFPAGIVHLLFLLSQQNIFTLPLLSRQGSFILILVFLTECFSFLLAFPAQFLLSQHEFSHFLQ